MAKRDYSLLGPDGRRAVETGLAAAEWYHTDIPRKAMKGLMQRSDVPAIRDTILYYGLMIVFAGIGIWLWPSGWSAPFWLAYGVLYGSASDSRWHECGHGTAFRTPWMNSVVYEIASFMIMRNSATWRWSHARHHTDTYIVGRDPEIAVMRPPVLFRAFLSFFGIPEVIEDGVSGLLVEPYDAEGLAEAISRLLLDHQLADMIGRAGHDVVRAKFCLDHMVAEVSAIYEEAVRPLRSREVPVAS